MIQNKFKVQKSLWTEFKTDSAKQVYNDVMEQSSKNQVVTVHPETKKIPQSQWTTICHNMACYAALSVLNRKLEKGTIVIDINRDNQETKRRKFN